MMCDQKRFLGPFMFRSRRIKNKINNIHSFLSLSLTHSLRKLVSVYILLCVHNLRRDIVIINRSVSALRYDNIIIIR